MIRFTHLPLRRLLWLTEFILLGLLALLIIQFLNFYFGRGEAPVLSQIKSGLSVQLESPLPDELNSPSVELRSLFGQTKVKVHNQPQPSEPVRETSLKLVLKGIIVEQDSDRRFALIADGNKQEKVYQSGDEIEGAELVRIDARRVLLRRNGNYESLSLKIERLERQAVPRAQFATDSSVNMSEDQQNVQIPRQVVKSQISNLKNLLKNAKAEPYTVNGKQLGYKVVQMNSDSIFQQLGLRENDVLRSVNGLSVRNTKEVLQAYRKLRNADALQLDLLRGDQDFTINYSIQ